MAAGSAATGVEAGAAGAGVAGADSTGVARAADVFGSCEAGVLVLEGVTEVVEADIEIADGVLVARMMTAGVEVGFSVTGDVVGVFVLIMLFVLVAEGLTALGALAFTLLF